MGDLELAADVDLHVQEILLASSQHDLTTLRHLLRSYTFPGCNSVDVQDPDTGLCPLHCAIASCESSDKASEPQISGTPNESSASRPLEDETELIESGRETIKCLLHNGAIWNQLDKNNETPGCMALRLGLKELYELMVDAGVRAELLLNRLEGYELLEDNENDTGAEEDGATANGADTAEESAVAEDVCSEQYLSSALYLIGDRLLDEQQNGIMMSWESDIMARSVEALLTRSGLRILNIGLGMGVIDTKIQAHANAPSTHHIVEAHSAVLAEMRSQGWHEKPNTVVHEGKWQDVIPKLAEEGLTFDAIYFDTFAESYSQFRDFFTEQVIALLEPEGRWSFFNGMGADRQISYDVYQKVVEMDLFEAGFDVEWIDVEVPKLEEEWEGVKRRYWNVKSYRLPVCRYMD
jgi:type IV protein arginine methyltransferase